MTNVNMFKTAPATVQVLNEWQKEMKKIKEVCVLTPQEEKLIMDTAKKYNVPPGRTIQTVVLNASVDKNKHWFISPETIERYEVRLKAKQESYEKYKKRKAELNKNPDLGNLFERKHVDQMFKYEENNVLVNTHRIGILRDISGNDELITKLATKSGF
jgi:hypothetical protein